MRSGRRRQSGRAPSMRRHAMFCAARGYVDLRGWSAKICVFHGRRRGELRAAELWFDETEQKWNGWELCVESAFQTPYFGGEYSEDAAEHLQEIVLETAIMRRRICTSCTIRKRGHIGQWADLPQKVGLQCRQAPAQETRKEHGNTNHKLSMSRLYGTAPFCRRIRQAGVRLLRLKLRYRRN